MLLSGRRFPGSGMLREAGEVLHEERRVSARQRDQGRANLDDTLATLALLYVVAWAEPLAGDAWRAAFGLAEAQPGAFLEWVARVLSQHLDLGVGVCVAGAWRSRARTSRTPARRRRRPPHCVV